MANRTRERHIYIYLLACILLFVVMYTPTFWKSTEIVIEKFKHSVSMEKSKNNSVYADYIVPTAEQRMCQNVPAKNDWSFRCSINCNPVKLSDIQSTSIDVKQSCISSFNENITLSRVSKKNLYSIPFQSRCLKELINDNCQTHNAVPSIVHYIWFTKRPMNFYHFLSFISVLKYLKPCLILVHGDLPSGEYWEYFLLVADNVVHVKMKPPTMIRGRNIGRVEHKADVARLLVLKEYGGIYVDTDEVILRPLTPLMNYNLTLSHALDDNLSNGLILAAPNATFISHWLDGYKTYTKSQWAYHSTILPYKLSKEYPNLLHVENKTFVKPCYTQLKYLFKMNYNWTNNYAIHLYIRFYKAMHNLYDIRRLNTTMGSVARHILYNTKELCYD